MYFLQQCAAFRDGGVSGTESVMLRRNAGIDLHKDANSACDDQFLELIATTPFSASALQHDGTCGSRIPFGMTLSKALLQIVGRRP